MEYLLSLVFINHQVKANHYGWLTSQWKSTINKVFPMSSARESHCHTFIYIYMTSEYGNIFHIPDDVIKWKHFPRYWPFVRGIHRSPVNSPHKGQRRGALVFSLISVWINCSVNNREAVDLRRHRAHYDVIVMLLLLFADKSIATDRFRV